MKILLLASLLLSAQVWAGMSVSSYNIRNFDRDPDAGPTNIAELTKTIKAAKSDIMTFIEVVNFDAFKTVIQSSLPGYGIVSSTCGGFGKQKLAVVYNSQMFNFVSMVEDLSYTGGATATTCGSLRPLMLVTLEQKLTKKIFTVAAVHLKAGGDEAAMRKRWMQYELLKKTIAQYKAKNLILMGDFNTTGWNIRDQDFTQFNQVLSVTGMRTSGEKLPCTAYWEGTPDDGVDQSSVLDHIIVSSDMARSVSDIQFGAHCAKLMCRDASPADLGVSYQAVSDHCPIRMVFR